MNELTLYKQASDLAISNKDEAALATEFLSRANLALDNLIEEEEKITKPLNEAIKAARAPLAAPKKQLKETIQILREKLSQYQTEESRRLELAAKDLSKGKISLDAALVVMANGPAEVVMAPSGTLTFQDKEVLKITNLALVPTKYFMVDEKVLLKDLKDGIKVKGCTLEIIKVPYNRR